MHSRYEVDRALSLVADGWNDSQISRATGINRTTIREWDIEAPGHDLADLSCPRCDEAPIDEPAYSYLLGLYLAGWYISREPRTYRSHTTGSRSITGTLVLA